MLSRYVVTTNHDGVPCLFNTVTKKSLPTTASIDELRANLFLDGQERDALYYGLNTNQGVLGLTIIPSWECNLRCKHCSVLTLLRDQQTDRLDADKLLKFTTGYINEYAPRWITLDFVGGEPLLRASVCLDILKKFMDLSARVGVGIVSNITTNATIDFTDDCWELLDNLDEINISIDGSEEHHNSQRIPFKIVSKGSFNPYERTCANLEGMIDRGYADKIRLKAAVRDDQLTKQAYEAFLRKFGGMGINIDRINYGCHHPTDHTDINRLKAFQGTFTARPVQLPCCKYRLSSVYLIEANGDVYDVPFKWARHKLGTLDDSIQTITNRRRQIIDDSFVCFKDAICMECPVIGYCWGGCVTADPLHNGKPSEHCNRPRLEKMVAAAAADGTLIKDGSKKTPLAILNQRGTACANS